MRVSLNDTDLKERVAKLNLEVLHAKRWGYLSNCTTAFGDIKNNKEVKTMKYIYIQSSYMYSLIYITLQPLPAEVSLSAG